MRAILAILLALCIAPIARADDADVLRLLMKIREHSTPVKVEKPATAKPAVQVPYNGEIDPSGNWRWSKAQWKWVQRQWEETPAQFKTEQVQVGKKCTPRGCVPIYETRQVQVAPASRVEVPLEEIDRNASAASLPADQQPTPMTAVGLGLDELNLKPTDAFVDFGCGPDARWPIVAVRDYGVKHAYGIEIDPEVADSARRHVDKAGLTDRVTIITGDARTVDVPANKGAAYLWPDTLAELTPQIKKLDRFVSYAHDVDGVPMRQAGDLFVYERPQPVVYQPQPVMEFRPSPRPVAYWNGRAYTAPKPGCNCAMCRSIKAQIGW